MCHQGINTAVARGDGNSAANNIGFAISVDEVLAVLPEVLPEVRAFVASTNDLPR